MSEIEITDDQREYLEDLRAELEEDVVYGHVRLSDALQFLIDSREEELTVDEEAVGSAPTDDEVDGAADAEAESTGEDGRDDDADDAEAGGVDGVEDENIDDADAENIDDADVDKTDDGSESDAEPDEGDADADDSDEDAEPAAAPTPGGGDRLNAMMQLLDTHDDKWREGSGDARYEVDLPDGSTETANTKDDVRALLFKNY